MRHLTRHGSLYGLLTLVFALIAALLAALPLVAGQLATDSLQRSIARLEPAERNVLLTGDDIPVEVNGRLVDTFGDLYDDTFELSKTEFFSAPYVDREGELLLFSPEEFDALVLHVYGYEDLADHATIVDGRWPEFMPEPLITPERTLIMEAVVGAETAAQLDLQVGDLLPRRNTQHGFQIVGIVAATVPDDPRWWGDEQLPFGFWRRISFTPDFVELNVGVMVSPDDMARSFPGNQSWRVLLKSERISPTNVLAVASSMRNLEATLSSQQVILTSPLLSLLNGFLDDIANGQLALLLLGAQAFLAILFTIYLLGQLILEQTAGELRTLSARGFSVARLTRQFGVRYAALAFLVAWPIGVLIATTALWRWPLLSVGPQSWQVPPLSWGLAGGALVICWVTLIIPIPHTVRQILIERQGPAIGRRSIGLMVDVVLIGLGALTVWQLRQFTARVQDESEAVALDPLLLLGPTLLIIGAALLLRHLAPLSIRGLATLSRRGRAFLIPTALTWLGRERARAGRLALLITLSTGLALFAAIFTHSLTVRQAEMALYQSGSSLRLGVLAGDIPAARSALVQDSRVGEMTTVFRGWTKPQTDNPSVNNELNFIAVDMSQPLALSEYPAGLSPNPMIAALSPLRAPATAGAIPVLISRRYVVPGTRPGDLAQMQIGRDIVTVEIRGILTSFPTLPDPFVVANLRDAGPILDSQPLVLALPKQYELWVSLEPETSGAAIWSDTEWSDDMETPLLLSDAHALHEQIRFHLLTQQVGGMFQFNAALLIVLTGGMLLIVLLLDGWRRRSSLGVMQSLGVSHRGVVRLLFWEGAALAGVGLVLGAILGVGLMILTRPLLTYTLATSLGAPDEVAPLVFQWGQLGAILFGVGLLYLAIISLAASIIARFDIARMMRV